VSELQNPSTLQTVGGLSYKAINMNIYILGCTRKNINSRVKTVIKKTVIKTQMIKNGNKNTNNLQIIPLHFFLLLHKLHLFDSRNLTETFFMKVL
jgi:hypothetical protein